MLVSEPAHGHAPHPHGPSAKADRAVKVPLLSGTGDAEATPGQGCRLWLPQGPDPPATREDLWSHPVRVNYEAVTPLTWRVRPPGPLGECRSRGQALCMRPAALHSSSALS